jgi:GDPmannose 4,6-dehydratase
MNKTALITGISGQDGCYLSEFLLSKGYTVHGMLRWDADAGTDRLKNAGILEKITLHYGDLTDACNLAAIIKKTQPDEIYNLAALSHVKVSFETPASALAINSNGTLNLLDAVRLTGKEGVRIYQASSSEMFGSTVAPQNESSPFAPCSPYGAAKLSAYWLARIYRESYGMHISNGILFNHESPIRGEDFVTRKIAMAAADIEGGSREILKLGNLESIRDWGHARDYVAGMWMMLQQKTPDDYVLATGEARSVRDFVVRAFAHVGIKIEWRGRGIHETGRDAKTGRVLMAVDENLFRPSEVNYLLGDASKARRALGWSPQVTFDTLVSEMVNAERGILWRAQGGDGFAVRRSG